MDKPRARQLGLHVVEVGRELVIYDADRQHYHTLNRTAVKVWHACDGSSTSAEIADSTGLAPDAVSLALAELSDIDLLQQPAAFTLDRRTVMTRLLAAGIALPVIGSITASSVSASGGQLGDVNDFCEVGDHCLPHLGCVGNSCQGCDPICSGFFCGGDGCGRKCSCVAGLYCFDGMCAACERGIQCGEQCSVISEDIFNCGNCFDVCPQPPVGQGDPACVDGVCTGIICGIGEIYDEGFCV